MVLPFDGNNFAKLIAREFLRACNSGRIDEELILDLLLQPTLRIQYDPESNLINQGALLSDIKCVPQGFDAWTFINKLGCGD